MTRPARARAWRVLRSRLLRTSALVPSLAIVGATSAVAQAVNLGRMNGNDIAPDGRTRTVLRGSGTSINIRSSTYAGGNAYNSFNTFKESPGTTVNLRARRGTKTIVNLVDGSAVEIDGQLNSFKGRKIGGRVVFADPYGFVVGPSGRLNVGTLVVVTPSGATLDQVVDSQGHVNRALAAQIISGDVPLSPDGSVIIQGRVDARRLVRVTAHDVQVAGSLTEARRAALHKAQFESTVNAGGLIEGSAIVVRNGSISIVAANDVSIGGRLSVRGRAASINLSAGHRVDLAATSRIKATSTNNNPSAAAPSITLNGNAEADLAGLVRVVTTPGGASGQIGVTGEDIHVAGTAAFIAQGLGATDGGHIALKSTNDTTVAAGAAFIANALGSGNGGLVEISAKAVDTVDPAISIDLRSKQGHAGTLLFDPDQLIITNQATDTTTGDDPVVGGTTSTHASLYTNGANVELDATGSITVAGVIDTRAYSGNHVAGPLAANGVLSQGSSGSILLQAPTITIASGGALYTDVSNGSSTHFTSGAINLLTGTNGTVAINGSIYGGAFTANTSGGSITVASGALIATRGGAVDLESGTVTLSGTVDTRNYAGTASAPLVAGTLATNSASSIGDSGSVTINAPNIQAQGGSAVYADANGGSWQAGDVTITANSSFNGPNLSSLGPAAASSAITLSGTITGRAISASSSSSASVDYTSTPVGFAALPAGLQLSFFTGLNGGYVAARSSATVTVGSTANIQGSGAVTLSSSGSETARQPAIAFSSGAQTYIAAVAMVGEVDATVATEVQANARISSGGGLNVTATNSATLSIAALSASVSSSVGATVAYSTGTITTRALIDPQATIVKAANVTVAAQNTNSFSTTASSMAAGNGSGGISIAISDIQTNATANLGASVPSSAGAKGVTVYSASNTTLNATQASTTVGSPALVAGILTAGTNASPLLSAIFDPGGFFGSGAVGQVINKQGSSSAIPRGGVTLSLNEQTQNSTASITGSSSQDAPTVYSTGPVAVVSLLTDQGIRSNASADITSSADGSIANPATSGALAMAVDVAQITHNSNAFIGSKVNVTGSEIGVDAQTSVPLTNTWTDFAGFSQTTSHLNGNLGIVSNILTSYANATANSSTTGISGAVNYFQITNNTTAWVGSGANLTQIAAAAGALPSDNPTFSQDAAGAVTISGTGFSSSDLHQDLTFPSSVVVQAKTTTESIDIGGNFSWLTIFGTNSTSSEGTAVGGSANADIFNSTTVAGIAAGTSVNALGSLSVVADTKDLVYGVAPTSGKGSGLGLNGIVSVLQIGNRTSASISNEAQVTASSVAINAQQEMSTFDIAGAVGYSKGTGFGLAVALASITTNTSAFVGENSTTLPSNAAGDDFNVGVSLPNFIKTPSLSVGALTVGRLTTISVAAEASNNAPDPTNTNLVLTSPSDASFMAKAVAFFAAGAEAIADKIAALSLPNQNLTNGTNSISGAGSSSVDLTSIGTFASIASATISAPTTGDNSVSVQALNNTIINTASGGAAIALGAPGSNYTVGVAGVVAVGLSNDSTSASVSLSSVTAKNVAVQALAGGQNTAVGIAVALTSGSGSNSAAVSAAVSFDEINDGVNASIDSSRLSGGTSSTGTLSVIADQTTNIGIGGGSLGVNLTGGGAGVGVALTYAQIGDPSGGNAVSAIISNSTVSSYADLSVEALDQSRIVSGAAVASGGADTTGFSGSIIVNEITPSIVAEIVGAPAVTGRTPITGGINVSGDVQVIASGGSDPDLDSTITAAAFNANGSLTPTDESHIDFSAGAVSPSSGTGAAIIAVAGQVGAGATNVGVSLVVNQIAQTHLAMIDGVTLTSTGGVVNVSANNSAEILGVAFGASGSSGGTAGLGSIVYDSISDSTIAQVGHDEGVINGDGATTIEAAAIIVAATDASHIRGAAGAIALNTSGGSAIGLSVVIDQISNYVASEVADAAVTADETLGNNSPLISGELTAGSVLVSGSSNASILTVAIGTAVSSGNNASGVPNPSPQSNFATLVAGLRPAQPTALASRGGSAAYFAFNPPPQPAPPPSNGIAGAGSIAISTEATTVNAYVGTDLPAPTSIAANANAIVQAANVDHIAAYAGAASVSSGAGAGIGASVVINTISGSTNAYANDASIDAQGQGNAASVDNGKLASPLDPKAAKTPASNPSFVNGTQSVHGIAIVASSQQTVDTVAIVASISTSSAALAANSVTNTMGGSTQAYASGSSLNTHLQIGSLSAVQITASSDSFANNLDIGVADSGGSAGGTVALVINLMNRSTNAYAASTSIGSSTVAAGDVAILANAWEGTTGEAVGSVGSDGVGLSGSSIANRFVASTASYLVGGTTQANSLNVSAATEDGYFGAVGNAALGASAGIGASVVVGIINNTTSAYVGDSAHTTTVHLGGGALTVAATTNSRTQSYEIGAAVGGSAGVSAMVTVNLVTNTTLAEFNNATVTLQPASGAAAGDIDITSTELASLNATSGGVAGGGSAGVGASANVVILKSSNAARIVGGTLSTPSALNVAATSNRDVNLVTVTAGLGAQAGLAGTVGVILIGDNSSSDQNSVISTNLASADASTGSNTSAALSSGVDGISASVIGGTVTAGSVTINATGDVATLNVVGALGVGGQGGFGAAIGYTEVRQAVTAKAVGGTIHTGTLSIAANAGDDGSGNAARTLSVAGAGGTYVGLGAAVAVSDDKNDVTAIIGSTVDNGHTTTLVNGVSTPVTVVATSVNVGAGDTSSVLADGYGAAIAGLGAVGVSTAKATRTSSVTSEILTGTDTTSTASSQPTVTANIAAQTVSVTASDAGATYALGIAGAAGVLGSGAAVDAYATNDATVLATIAGASTVAASSGITVSATDMPDAKAFGFGVAIAGGATVGLALADAETSDTLTANVDGAAVITSSTGLSISATAGVKGTPATSFPASATLPASTTSFQSGGTNAAAWSIAASGALYYAGSGAQAKAHNSESVTAETGDGLALPSGAVSISAINKTDQFARGTGVSIGADAVGVVIVEASADTTTHAQLGNSTTTPSASASNPLTVLTISAQASDTNNAYAQAGAGGFLAGNGSEAKTIDTSHTRATIGQGSVINAAAVALSASHNDVFGEMADSLNASAVGASAALATHTASSDVEANVGDNVNLNVSAAGQAICAGNGCVAAISLSAENDFNDASSGTREAAGGGINGAGATSTISIDQDGTGASVSVGAGDRFISGTDPTLAPGSIALLARTSININDQDTLQTGGYIQGAGVNSTVDGTLNNTITINAGASLATRGSLDLATYTTGSVAANSYVSTYGVAAVGVADAGIDLTDNETINVLSAAGAASPTALGAFYNVYVTAGEDLTHALSNAIAGSTSAQGYVKGLIAVPTASANTILTSNATVVLGTNTAVIAGENVTIDAYYGSPSATADGTGHGYELGFIPVTDGHTSHPVTTSSNVTIGGSVIAGEYATLTLTVNADGTVSENSGGAPVSTTYLANPTSSCAGALTSSCLFTATEYATLLSHGDVSSSNIAAIRLGALFASGGSIEIKADTLHGSGSLVANGNPSITVLDAQDIALVFYGGALIPNISAGAINFTGGAEYADATRAGIHVLPTANSAPGAITISLTNTSGDHGAGPPIIVDAPITNLGGSIVISNANGSLVYQTIYKYDSAGNVVLDSNGNPAPFTIGGSQANQLLVTVPYGALIVDANTADGSYIVGSSPAIEFAGWAVYPGNLNGSDPNTAAEYVASSIYQNNLQSLDGVTNNQANASSSAPGSAIDKVLYGIITSSNASQQGLILFGACGRGGANQGGGACAPSGYTIDGYTQPSYINETLRYSTNDPSNESTSGSANSKQIYGNLIEVHAATIDVNGAIYAGPATTYDVSLSSSAGSLIGQLATMHNDYYSNLNGFNQTFTTLAQELGQTNQTYAYLYNAAFYGSVDVSRFLTFGANSATDVTATFNFSTQQITLSSIEAHSIGASVTLDGAIISSNTLGNIHVNSGFGQVSIDNESGYGLVVSGINTGSVANATAATSTVMIVDRLIDQKNGSSANDTKTYIYNPNTGLAVYRTSNGASPVDGSGNALPGVEIVSTSSGSVGAYNPVAGAAYEYVQEAQLQRSIPVSGNNVFGSPTSWYFVGNPNQPYYYVSPGSVPSTDTQSASPASAQSQSPVGTVIIESASAPLYQETIYGNVLRDPNNQAVYGNANGCYQGYPCNGPFYGGVLNHNSDGSVNYSNEYFQFYPDRAFIRVTSIERADNQIAISFTGNATGVAHITSNAAVTLAGDIKNPNGTTTINTSAGGSTAGLTQAAGSSLTGTSINLTAGGSIGFSGAPLVATLTNGSGSSPGAFYANAGSGGVYIQLNSPANGFSAIAQNGDVVVHATGALAALNANRTISGNNVTIVSAQGGIGSSVSPFTIQANGTLNLSAQNDIGFQVPTGDLRIGQINSTAGNVSITVANGNIYDALSQTSASTLSPQQVSSIAAALHLTDTNDAAAGAVAISGFESLVDSDLATYNAFLANGSISIGQTASIVLDASTYSLYSPLANAAAIQAQRAAASGTSSYTTLTNGEIQASANNLVSANGLFTLRLTQANRAGFQVQVAAALGISDPTTVSDTQIQAWANARFQSYATTFSEAYGSSWQSTVTGSGAPTSFTVARSSNSAALTRMLTASANWTPQQLVQAIDRSALEPAQTNVGSGATADIIGHDVSLTTVNGAIGTYNPNGLQISFQQLTSGTLSTADQAALAVATAPGSVSLIGHDSSGNALPAGTGITNLAPGSTITAINIAQTRPVFIQASGALSVNSSASVYLQGTSGSSISLDHVTAQGDVNIQAPGSITAATNNGVARNTPIVSTSGNLSLSAGNGSIGSSALPITYRIGGAVVGASAAIDSYLAAIGTDARIQRDFAGRTASLTTGAGYSIVSALNGVNVNAATIFLGSGADIGTTNTAFSVEASDHLSGTAAGAINIAAPSLGGGTANNLTIGTLVGAGSVKVSSSDTLTIETSLSSSNGDVTTASNKLAMQASGSAGQILAAGTVTISTLGDADLGFVQTAVDGSNTTDGSIAIQAGGSILTYAGGGVTISSIGSGSMTLTATGSIGSLASPGVAATPLVIDASHLVITASATNGSISLSAPGVLDATSVSAAGQVVVSGDSLLLGSVTSGGTQTIGATGSIHFGTLQANAGDADVTSTGSSIIGTSVLATLGGSQLSATSGAITIGSVTTALDQTLTAQNDIKFATLKTTGTGSISVMSTAGAVAPQSAGSSLIQSAASVTINGKTVMLDTVTASGNATIDAQVSLVGTQLTTTNGFVSLTAGSATSLSPATPTSLAWTTIQAGSTASVDAYGGSITSLGSVTSGGTQTIGATGSIHFGTLQANAGDVDVTSSGSSITGTGVLATLGRSQLSATSGAITIGTVTTALDQTLTAQNDITFATLKTTGTGSIGVMSTAGAVAPQSAGSSLIQSAANVTINGKTVMLDTVTASGNATIDAQVSLAGTQLTTTNGFVNLTAGSATSLSPATPTSLAWATIQAGSTASFEAYGGSITSLGSVTSGGTQTIGATGSIQFGTLQANAGDVDVTSSGSSITGTGVLATLGRSQLSATSGAITIGTVTTALDQTLTAQNDITFATLKTTGTGSIGVMSAAGAVAPQSAGSSLIQSAANVTINGKTVMLDTVTASGNATIDAQVSLVGTQLTTTNGFVSLTAGSATSLSPATPTSLAWATIQAGSTASVDAYGGSITSLGSVTSGGTQTIGATGSIQFGTLQANAGDADVTSTGGSITGTHVLAHGDANLTASSDNSGTSITAVAGSISLSSTTGRVAWGTIIAATRFSAIASTESIELGTVTSGGTQTLTAQNDVRFTTLQTTGTSTDQGSIYVTARTGMVAGQPSGSSLIQTNADVTISGENVALDNVSALGSARLTSVSTLAGTELTTRGDAFLTAGQLAWNSLSVGGSVTLSVVGMQGAGPLGTSALALGTITSGRGQTITSVGDVSFSTLIAQSGDVAVTSQLGRLSGQNVTAGGGVALSAAGNNTGSQIIAQTGSVSLLSTSGQIAWGSVSSGATFAANASHGRISLGSAMSASGQDLEAAGDISFASLTNTSTGAINVNAGGTITAPSVQSAGNIGLSAQNVNAGTFVAQGQTTINAAQDVIGNSLMSGGVVSISATAGNLTWTTLNAAHAVTLSAGGQITLGTVSSAGTQTITSQHDLVFTQLSTSGDGADAGNVNLQAVAGAVRGGSIAANGAVNVQGVGITFDTIAAPLSLSLTSGADISGNAFTTNGTVSIDAAGTTSLGGIQADTLSLSTPGTIAINDLTVASAINLAADTINIGVLRQAPGATGPLTLALTGYKGSLGSNAILNVIAPNGIVITQLREDPVSITTTARQVAIEDAYLTGTMRLTTPLADLWFNDRSSQPVLNNSVQFFKPDGRFYFVQDGSQTLTNSYVIQYDATAAIRQDVNGVIYYGASFVRDIDRLGHVGDPLPGTNDDGSSTLWSFPVDAFDEHLERLRRKSIQLKGPGPAVNLPPVSPDPLGFNVIFTRASR